MAKKTELQREIEKCEAEIGLLQQVLSRLKAASSQKPKAKPRPILPSHVDAKVG